MLWCNGMPITLPPLPTWQVRHRNFFAILGVSFIEHHHRYWGKITLLKIFYSPVQMSLDSSLSCHDASMIWASKFSCPWLWLLLQVRFNLRQLVLIESLILPFGKFFGISSYIRRCRANLCPAWGNLCMPLIPFGTWEHKKGDPINFFWYQNKW